MSRSRTLLQKGLCLAVCLWLTGCTGMHHGTFTAVPDDQSERVLASLRVKESAIRQLRGLFQASVSGAGIPFSQRFNGMMSYDSPDRVHLTGILAIRCADDGFSPSR